MQARRGALAVSRQHRGAQALQASGTNEAGQRQSARREAISEMDQRAGQIVRSVERAEADYGVEAGSGVRGLMIEVSAGIELSDFAIGERRADCAAGSGAGCAGLTLPAGQGQDLETLNGSATK